VARLRACALVVLKRIFGLRQRDKNFTLQGAVRDFEARFIEQALDEAEGSVTRAAELLGMKYQTLANLLKTRHKRLQKKRTPAKERKRSIIK
jgi:DNA-binding NtrC family response regulator